MSRIKKIGPGAVVAAAFIGPGIITSANFAGSSYGFTLAWAVLFSTFATFVLQEMAMRLGIIGQKGLGEAMRNKINHPLLKTMVILIIISAIVIGNAAYEAGNISGAALGFEVDSIPLFGFTLNPMVLGIGLLAGLILLLRDEGFITKFLMACVGVMGFVFIVSAFALKPNMWVLIKNMFHPQIPSGSLKLVLALIGTTVVPYNLFLHASVSKNNWNEASDLPFARKDALISIVLGGLITLSILIAAAMVKTQTGTSIETLPQMAKNISPVLGDWSGQFMALGFLAAGLSSAITAPMAAAWVVLPACSQTSTVDLAMTDGTTIPIEQRAAAELLILGGQSVAAGGTEVWNPSFDVTPADLVDVLVTERGVVRAPNAKKMARMMDSAEANFC